MTAPSELSDADLRLAIAEKLGYKWYEFIHPDKGSMGERLLLKPSFVGRSLVWREADMTLPYDKIDSVSNVPNYLGDIEAAMGLLDKFKSSALIHLNWLAGAQVWEATIVKEIGPPFQGESKSFARAISEAAYMAMKGE